MATKTRSTLVVRTWPLGTATRKIRRAPRLIAAAAFFVVACAVPLLALRVASAAISIAFVASSFFSPKKAKAPALLIATRRGLYREDAMRATLLCEWGAGFGMSWLVGKDAMLAFTTAREVRCVRVRLEDTTPESQKEIKRRASPMADSAFEVFEDSLSLDAADALSLAAYCEQKSPRCESRVLASGLRGERVMLDGTSLVINDKSFDLSSPLEWRSAMFHEVGGASAMLFSSLSVRQKGAEVVFVTPAHGDLKPPFDGPPSRESRVAIDALLLSPIRRAVARAPRIKRSAPSAPRGPREQTA